LLVRTLTVSISARMLDPGDRLGDVDRSGPDGEAAANRRQPEQVPGRERDGRGAAVDLVPPRLRCRLRHR
jgi:hypothetical protein